MTESEVLLSIVIPTFARPMKLRACLEAVSHLRAEDVPFEVVVVDDGGPQPATPVVADFANRLNVRLVTQSRGGPGVARNAGAAAARGQFLAFIDDDCTPATDWLAVMATELGRDPGRLLGGRVENALGENPYAEASERISRYVYDYNRSNEAHEPFFTSNNIALSADLFRALGGFATTIPSATAEDKEFCDRWRARGLRLVHVPTAVVFHAHDLTFARFLRQHYRYGRGILAFRLLRRARVQSGIVPEPWKFYVRLILSPMRDRTRLQRWRGVALLVFSQMATLAGALRESMRWRLLARARAAQPTEL